MINNNIIIELNTLLFIILIKLNTLKTSENKIVKLYGPRQELELN